MQNDTMVGFFIVGICILLNVVIHYLGVNGDIQNGINVLSASGLILLTGKKVLTKKE